jgi:hypothetical protein
MIASKLSILNIYLTLIYNVSPMYVFNFNFIYLSFNLVYISHLRISLVIKIFN